MCFIKVTVQFLALDLFRKVIQVYKTTLQRRRIIPRVNIHVLSHDHLSDFALFLVKTDFKHNAPLSAQGPKRQL